MEKYASMWKADTPVERQAEARELWDNLTGINHSKEDTTARLERLFPQANTHNKEAKMTASKMRDLMIGTGIGLGGTGAGIAAYSSLKKNPQGISEARASFEASEAGKRKLEELGYSEPGRISRALTGARRKAVEFSEQNPALAGLGLAGAGALAGGLSARSVAKRIKDSVK